MVGRGDDDQLLVEHRHLLERRVGDRLGGQRGIELAVQDGGGELTRIAGAQLQRHGRIAAVIRAERPRQAHGGGALHGAEAQHAARMLLVHRLARLAGQVEQAVGIAQQRAAGRRDVQALALADEELDAQVVLELADAGGDVGLHAVQLLGGARDAAGADDGAEDVQVDEIHRSQSKMIIIIIIHFSS